MEFYNVKCKTFADGKKQVVSYSRTNIVGFVSPNKGKKREPIDWSKYKMLDIKKRFAKIKKDSMNRTKNKVYDIARSNVWQWFVTLTFNPEKVDSFDYDACSKKVSKWLNNLKSRKAPDIIYLGVPEQHKSGRYHFHFLMSNCENMEFIDSGKTTDSGLPIYNLGIYKWGFSTAIEVYDTSGISGYITKYITKDLLNGTRGKKGIGRHVRSYVRLSTLPLWI